MYKHEGPDANWLSLQDEVRHMSRQCPPDVDKWIEDAYSIQMQANKSRSLVREIVREDELGEELREAVEDKETHLDLLTKEALFNAQLLETLTATKLANDLMDDMERIAKEKDFIKALNLGDGEGISKSAIAHEAHTTDFLADADRVIETLKVDNKVRAKCILQTRYKNIRTNIHGMLTNNWRALVHINSNEGTVRIRQKLGCEMRPIIPCLIVNVANL